MTDPNHPNYSSVIEAVVGRAEGFIPGGESATSVRVERGIVLPASLSDRLVVSTMDRLIELADQGDPARIAVVDAGGHHRPVYRPLLVYCWLLAREISPVPGWGEGLGPWCETVRNSLSIAVTTDLSSAAHGAQVGDAVWSALVTFIAGEAFNEQAWIDLGRETFRGVCHRQQSSGAFLASTARDNPETFWYHELILLHAMSSFAARTNDETMWRSVDRSSAFHLNETQPDHATAQPWGLPAFVRYAPMLADQILHTIHTQQPGGIDGVSLMLLADTLYGLRRNDNN